MIKICFRIILVIVGFYIITGSITYKANIVYIDPQKVCCEDGLCGNGEFCTKPSSMSLMPYCQALTLDCFKCINNYYTNMICDFVGTQEQYCIYWDGDEWKEYRGGNS